MQEFTTTPDVLGPNIKYSVRVEIHGDTVELYGGEVGQAVEKKTEWTFDGGVLVGRIGLGGWALPTLSLIFQSLKSFPEFL